MPLNGTILHNILNRALEETCPEDRNVIESTEGPVLVYTATGKRMAGLLALRTGNILLQSKTLPENILWITGTAPAATALKINLEKVIGPDASKVYATTLQDFCSSVIEDNFSLFKKKSPAPNSTVESIRIFKSIIEAFPKNHPLKRYRGDVYHEINNLQALFSGIKKKGWTTEYLLQQVSSLLIALENNNPFQTAEFRKEKETLEKLRAGIIEFDHYQRLLKANNRYDRDDCIYLAGKAFEENKELLSAYRQKFQYIQVDGYPVKNKPADKLFQLLLSNIERPNVLLISNIEKKGEAFSSLPKAGFCQWKEIDLTNCGNATPRQGFLNGPLINVYNTTGEEMAGITNQVCELLQNNIEPEKIAVVYQENENAAKLEQYFSIKNIPFYSRRTLDILKQPFTKKIFQLLRYIREAHAGSFIADELLFEILHFDFYRIPPGKITGLTVEVSSRKYSSDPISLRKLIQERSHAPRRDLFDTGIHKKIIVVVSSLDHLIEVAPGISLQQLFENVIHNPMIRLYVDQSEDSIWLKKQVTVLSDFINTETTRNTLLSLNELMAVMDIMEREMLPLAVNCAKGSTSGVQIIKAMDTLEQEVNYVFIAGANASPHTGEDWINAIDKLGGNNLSSSPGTNEGIQINELFNGSNGFLSGKVARLIISYAKNDDKGRPMLSNGLATEIVSRYSSNVQNVEFTGGELSYYQGMLQPSTRPQIEQSGKTIIAPILQKFVMNVSALNSYLNCPLGFYFKNIIRIPEGKNEAMEFGSAIHYALEMLFKKMLEGHLASSGEANKKKSFPPPAEMIEIFSRYMEQHRAHFTEEAFNRRIQYGGDILLNYYNTYISQWNQIVSVERNFRGIIVNGIPVKGKIDKLEFNGKEVNIVDYKTGDIEKARSKLTPPNDDTPNGGDYWRQAVFYKILVDNYPNKNWRAVGVEFDFIEPDKNREYRKEKIEINAADIATVTQQLTDVWNKIQAQQFYTGCGKPNCHWCSFVKDNNLQVAMQVGETT